jgi:predicted esterase
MMFKASSHQPYKGLHQSMSYKHAGVSLQEAEYAMIMIHGRGASAESILGLTQEFTTDKKIAYLAPQASGFTWYPYSFLAPTDQNQPGLNSGLQAIYDLIEEVNQAGIGNHNIYLLGFSQGACLASEFVARHPDRFAGLFVLSGGLIGETLDPKMYDGDLDQTPIFMGCSNVDAHIPEQRVHDSAEIFEQLNAQITKKIYPAMGHTINQDEIEHINRIVNM